MRTESYGSVKVFWPDFSREELIERLHGFMPALQRALPVTTTVLFGSWAKGRATVASDIDLMVIYEDPEIADAFSRVRGAVDIMGLEPHIYTQSQAAKLKKTLDAMMDGGVDLLERD